MTILLLLVPISLALLGLAIWAFVWAVRRGQFDDLDTPPLDILREDTDGPRPLSGHDRGTANGNNTLDEGRLNEGRLDEGGRDKGRTDAH